MSDVKSEYIIDCSGGMNKRQIISKFGVPLSSVNFMNADTSLKKKQ